MITVVNEPQAGYKVADWQITKSKIFPLDELIFRMDNHSVFIQQPSFSEYVVFINKPKRRLSKLRGKMVRQNEKEIDDQILDLRDEWDRNI
jgi:hypothetical protein